MKASALSYTIMLLLSTHQVQCYSTLPTRGDNAVRYTPGHVSAVLDALKRDNTGAIDLGDDGVLRSYSGSGAVVDYANLDNAQLTVLVNALNELGDAKMLARSPPTSLDGREVTDLDALLSRRESLMPRESNGMSTRSTLASRELPCNIFICDNGQQCLNLETAECTGCVVGRCITSGFPHPGPIDK